MLPSSVRKLLLAVSAAGVTAASTGIAAMPVSASALPPSLVGTWAVTQGDCAFGCLNVNYRFEFDSDGAYTFAEEHRSTENEGGFPFTCIDETYLRRERHSQCRQRFAADYADVRYRAAHQ